MLNYFIFNGQDSRDFGIFVRNKNSYNAPVRDVDVIHVPGRNGDVLIDNGSYNNITITYNVLIVAPKMMQTNQNIDAENAIADIKKWLYSGIGAKKIGTYGKLIDSYNEGYYRKAAFAGELEVESSNPNYLYAKISFYCNPYRYRIDGDNVITITPSQNHVIYNPERETSFPLIRLYGEYESSFLLAGRVYSFDFTDLNIDYVDIDSELEIVYKGSVNYSHRYSAGSVMFPRLQAWAGNTFTFQQNISKIEINPRWRAI